MERRLTNFLDDIAGQIANHMDKIERFEDVKQISFEEALKSGLTKYIDESVEEDYYKEVLNLTINDKDLDKKINVVYTFKRCRKYPCQRNFEKTRILKIYL